MFRVPRRLCHIEHALNTCNFDIESGKVICSYLMLRLPVILSIAEAQVPQICLLPSRQYSITQGRNCKDKRDNPADIHSILQCSEGYSEPGNLYGLSEFKALWRIIFSVAFARALQTMYIESVKLNIHILTNCVPYLQSCLSRLQASLAVFSFSLERSKCSAGGELYAIGEAVATCTPWAAPVGNLHGLQGSSASFVQQQQVFLQPHCSMRCFLPSPPHLHFWIQYQITIHTWSHVASYGIKQIFKYKNFVAFVRPETCVKQEAINLCE